jgi:hypothetical protein
LTSSPLFKAGRMSSVSSVKGLGGRLFPISSREEFLEALQHRDPRVTT